MGGVEVVDGLDQADVADLQQVFGRFGTAVIGVRAGADQPGIPGDQDLADGVPFGAAARQRAQSRQQLVVGQLFELGMQRQTEPTFRTGHACPGNRRSA